MQSAWESNSLTLTIEGEPTLGRFTLATEALAGILREVSERVTGRHRSPVRWVVSALEKGSLVLEVRGQPAGDEVVPAIIPSIISAVTSGVATIQQRPVRPRFFSDLALENAKTLAETVDSGVVGLRMNNGHTGVVVTRQLAANVDELIGARIQSYGTVEGWLEAITIHGRQQFTVYEPLDGHRVRCLFGQQIPLDDVVHAFGKRVAVSGSIRSRKTGERVEVLADELRVFPAESELISADAVTGILGR